MTGGATVLTTSPGFATRGDVAERLARAGFRLLRHSTDDAALAGPLGEARYLVAGLVPVTEATLAAAPRLRAVLKHGVGLDSIDVGACSARGIPVLSTPGANGRAVAEMALGAIFGLARNMVRGHLSVVSGGWERRAGRELGGAALGLVGFGRIGQELAAMARGIGMTVVAHDPWAAPEAAEALGVRLTTLDGVLEVSDYVSLHVTGGPGTKGLISGREMDLMKPGAALVNFARGGVIDLDALRARLESGHLSGAAIDAYETEPPDRADPIFADPRVIFSPHSGADTVESLIRMGGMVVDDILALERGARPARIVNADSLPA